MMTYLPYVSSLSYHPPLADICLFHHKTHHQIYDGSSELDNDRVVMHLKQQIVMSICYDINVPLDHHLWLPNIFA